MLLAYEIFSDDRVQAYAPIGQRTPTINPAGGVKHINIILCPLIITHDYNIYWTNKVRDQRFIMRCL